MPITKVMMSQMMQKTLAVEYPPLDSTTNPLISIRFSINFIYTCCNALEFFFAWHCFAYQENTKELFNQISTENLTPIIEVDTYD